jgi:hypothetical protein
LTKKILFALFLQDLTIESLDLLPTSPPKVVNCDFSSIISGKSPVKSNKTTRAAIDQKKPEKNAKGKEVHKVNFRHTETKKKDN